MPQNSHDSLVKYVFLRSMLRKGQATRRVIKLALGMPLEFLQKLSHIYVSQVHYTEEESDFHDFLRKPCRIQELGRWNVLKCDPPQVASELRWYGRAAVIYDAMKPMLYTREPDVLSSLYPAITQVAQVLEADPAKSGKLQSVSFIHIFRSCRLVV